MKVDVQTVGSFQKRLEFEVPPDQVRTRMDAAYRQLAHRIRLPGFRPGKAPRQVLEARFGPQVKGDVARDLIEQSYRTALSEKAIDPVGQPSLAEATPVDDASGFRFSITVDVRPSIDLEQWTGVAVVWPTVEVKDAEVDAAVKSRLEGQARLEEVTGRPVHAGDLAMVELHVKDGENEVSTEPGTMIRTAGDPYYPGLEALLEGLEVGAERTGRVAFGPGARIEAVAGRELDATVKVLAIHSHTVPELTDALATELGFEGGVQGMRTALAARIRLQRDELARNQARANLLEALIARNRFEVPAGMVETSLKMLMEELRMQQAMRTGRDPRTIGFTDAQVKDLRMRAEFAAKAGLILEWVARRESIAVDEGDLDRKYRELSDQRGQTVEAVKGWFQKEDAVAELKDRILEEKTLDWLLERAEVKAPGEPAKPVEAEAAAPAPAGGLEILDGKIDALKEALAAGDFDDRLDALLESEKAGRNRKGAITAIEARKNERGA